MEHVDILIENANELITLQGSNKPRLKKGMNDLSIIQKGSIAISNGNIVEVGKDLQYKADKIINAKGKMFMPHWDPLSDRAAIISITPWQTWLQKSSFGGKLLLGKGQTIKCPLISGKPTRNNCSLQGYQETTYILLKSALHARLNTSILTGREIK